MAETDQIVQDAVDAAIFTAIDDEEMQTLSSVRAEPTVLISDDDWKYKDFPFMGVCVIINNVDFLPSTGLPPLPASDKDSEAAKVTFETLGYNVIVKRNLTAKEMENELEEVSNRDHSDNKSFVCVILSHGNEHGIYGTDKIIPLDDLTQYFKGSQCESLLGKPKLFFLDACRGTKMDEGVILKKVLELAAPQKIPVEADFLYAYATAPGYRSWIRTTGSWFIQSLCKILSNPKDLELMQLLTRVNRKVAYDYQTHTLDPKTDGKKEIPCITSMLTKEFYFTKNH